MVGVFTPQRRQRASTARLDRLRRDVHQRQQHERVLQLIAGQPQVARPLQHQPLTASGDIGTQPGDWKAANAAVAEFPRGHGDVLKWEKAQNPTTKTTEQAAPAHGHHDHGGQQ